MNIKVLKFGGTSMGTVESITQSSAITAHAAKTQQIIVVVSALSGITDQLIALIEAAKKQKTRQIKQGIQELEKRHQDILAHFVEKNSFETAWKKEFEPIFDRMKAILTGISLVGDLTEESYVVVCSFGERLASWIMYEAMKNQGIKTTRIGSEDLIKTDSNYLAANVDFKKTKTYFQKKAVPALKKGNSLIIPGFIAKDSHGKMTLLGRGGSDYTACIAGICTQAEAIEVWTDVDGIMSADPRKVKKVKTWESIEMYTMAEMAYGGAKVLHPKTITAAVQHKIPVFIKNTFNPKAKGTKVVSKHKPGLRGVVLGKKQVLIHLVEPSMLGSTGFINSCSKIFAKHKIPIDVCATSEISFTCSIEKSDFTPQLSKDLTTIAEVENIYDGLSKVCIIGNKVTDDTDLLARVFSTLRSYQIFTASIGASFNNITLIVNTKEAHKIVDLLHAELFGK